MQIDYDYAWSTHQPLLKAALETFNPKLIVELGMGIFSTPLFIDNLSEKLICIENDEEWYYHMKGIFDDAHDMRLNKLTDGVTSLTFPKQLNSDQRKSITDYYKSLSLEIQSYKFAPKFLFVDNFTCCRTIAINTLYNDFDIIAYHDCQPEGIRWYEYYFIEALKKEFNNYLLKTPKSWTGIFIKNNLDVVGLCNSIVPFINQYCIENVINNNQIYLERQR
jgi:hypothetical protein